MCRKNNLPLGENRFFTLMNTIEQDVDQDTVEYFYDNFTLESLKYIKREIVKTLNDNQRMIDDQENEVKRLQDCLVWLQNGMDNQKLELKAIDIAIQKIKEDIGA